MNSLVSKMNPARYGLTQKNILVILSLFVLFFLIRLPAVHMPYHQDEYKWPLYSDPTIYPPGSVPHPPLTEFIYRVVAPHFGYDNFRFVPLLFSSASFFLVFLLARKIFDKRTAFISLFLYVVSYYSILASLMVDTDGAVMPFFFLIMAYAYYSLRDKGLAFKRYTKTDWIWFVVFCAAAVAGFLVKVSFLLGLVACGLDYAFEKRMFSNWKKIGTYLLIGLGVVFGFGAVLLISKFLFPYFNLEFSLKYWEHFAVFRGRGWLQTFIQFAKSLLYTSPLLIIPAFVSGRDIWKKTRPLYMFIFTGLVFYLIAFDFSLGALDRYFEFLVVPLCIISGAVYAAFLQKLDITGKAWAAIVSCGIFAVQFLPQSVPSLYPKTEWISRALHLKWNFLFPFTGGSGPTGFYISFAFMGLMWLVTSAALVFIYRNKEWKSIAITFVFILGLVYNGAFIEEYLFGAINGNSTELFREAKSFVAKDDSITSVVVYNDIGGYEIRQMGKYTRRLYAAPQFEEGYREFFKTFKGHVLFVGIPRIDDSSFYAQYLASCTPVYSKSERYINSAVYDCRNSGYKL